MRNGLPSLAARIRPSSNGLGNRSSKEESKTKGKREMKRTFLSIFMLLITRPFLSCSTQQKNETSGSEESSSNSNHPSLESGSGELIQNASVIYFSATNHTEEVAKAVAAHIHSAIHELEPTNPYSAPDLNYSGQNSRVVQECLITQWGEKVGVELNQTNFDSFTHAKYIFLGASVWWQQLSWVVENFVSSNDFSNKTIIPFGTSSNSGFSLDNLTPLTQDDENVTWLALQRFSSFVSETTVTDWVDSLDLEFESFLNPTGYCNFNEIQGLELSNFSMAAQSVTSHRRTEMRRLESFFISWKS